MNNYCEVFDNHASNIESGFDYYIQESSSTHLQDIAVRRVVFRFGLNFKGDKLLEIRGSDSNGHILSPGKIPFHLPHLIEENDNNPSWSDEKSIEAFWQCNKVLVVKTSCDKPIEKFKRDWLDNRKIFKIRRFSNKIIWKYLKLNRDLDERFKYMPDDFKVWMYEIKNELLKEYQICHKKYDDLFLSIDNQAENQEEFVKLVLSLEDPNKKILFEMYRKNSEAIDYLIWKAIKPEFLIYFQYSKYTGSE